MWRTAFPWGFPGPLWDAVVEVVPAHVGVSCLRDSAPSAAGSLRSLDGISSSLRFFCSCWCLGLRFPGQSSRRDEPLSKLPSQQSLSLEGDKGFSGLCLPSSRHFASFLSPIKLPPALQACRSQWAFEDVRNGVGFKLNPSSDFSNNFFSVGTLPSSTIFYKSPKYRPNRGTFGLLKRGVSCVQSPLSAPPHHLLLTTWGLETPQLKE